MDEPPSPDEISSVFRGACHGGHLRTAQYLHGRGAGPDRCGYDGVTPLDIARARGADDVVRWLRGLDALSAR
ncbi:ankyrin repeat domain-containing protein [Streptomyces sp. NPDC059696]|uniref:ankyrin repeat domain-containing protein n=1 Tax=Streptomyces sp. NPDC059696 TaxID=3346911 RepID=UPI0036745092